MPFRDDSRPDGAAPPRLVLCAGQHSSASTWLYNAVHALLAEALGPDAVRRAYAETPDELPSPAQPGDAAAAVLVVKTHRPTPGFDWLLHAPGARAVLTLRDPRDAAASLMVRFAKGFAAASRMVAGCSDALPRLADAVGRDRLLELRYEDGFQDDPATLPRLAEFLGVEVPPAALERIAASLTRDAVRTRIEAMAEAGAFGEDRHPDRFDPETHWHPGHVGDGRSGKFAALMTPGQIAEVIRRSRAYQRRFGYPMPPPPPLGPGETPLPMAGFGPGLAYLAHGFAPAEEDGVWTEGEDALLRLPLALPPDHQSPAVRLDLDLALPQAAPGRVNPARWRVAVNGIAAGRGEAASTPPRLRHTVALPPGALPQGTEAIEVAWRFEGLVPMRALGLGADPRRFGLKLRALGVEIG